MRPLRFGLGLSIASDADEYLDRVRRAESIGYSTLLVADHLGIFSPETALAAAASVTSDIRLGSFVFNNDLRHPLVLAQQAATLDILSGGRFELGLGAGWNQPEYDAAGIPFDRASVRIDRMAETATILRRLFSGEEVTFSGDHYRIQSHTLHPQPPQGADLPILMGGNGNKMLTAAATHADIIGLVGVTIGDGNTSPFHLTAEGIRERIEFVRRVAGSRGAQLEFNALSQHCEVTEDREAAAAGMAERLRERAGIEATTEDLLDSPFVMFGTVDELIAQIRRYRDDLGISYFTFVDGRGSGFDPIVEELAGR